MSIGVGAEEEDEQFINLVDYTKRIINSMNIKDDNDTTVTYSLDPTTEAYLYNIASEPCPEFTFETSSA